MINDNEIMKVDYNEFIGIYKNVYPPGYCSFMIEQFENLEQNGVGRNRQMSDGVYAHLKQDHQIFLDISNHPTLNFNNEHPVDIFYNGLQRCYDEYTTKYSVLKTSGSIRGMDMKMQRTSPGGGYHVWHAEQGEGCARRVLVYMLYLNTVPVEEAAETEFLYQRLRINPVENTLIIWPAAYTHAHRGNPLLGEGYKYVITGWFSFD